VVDEDEYWGIYTRSFVFLSSAKLMNPSSSPYNGRKLLNNKDIIKINNNNKKSINGVSFIYSILGKIKN
jgi:hypothetical protein